MYNKWFKTFVKLFDNKIMFFSSWDYMNRRIYNTLFKKEQLVFSITESYFWQIWCALCQENIFLSYSNFLSIPFCTLNLFYKNIIHTRYARTHQQQGTDSVEQHWFSAELCEKSRKAVSIFVFQIVLHRTQSMTDVLNFVTNMQ